MLLISLGFIITFFQKAVCLKISQITRNLFSEFKGIFVLRNDGPYEKTGKMEPSPFDFESF